MTYTTDFEYTSASALKVSNVVAFLDKRNGSIVVEFDARGKDWTAGVPYPQAKIKYLDVVKSTIDLTNLSNAVSRHRVTWSADTSTTPTDTALALINHGSLSIVLDVDDEDDDTTTFTQSIIVDLDPVEFFFTALEEVDFGDYATPKIEFTLKDFRNKNTKITPTVKIDSAGASGASVTVTTSTGSSSYASGYIVLNGVKFTDTNLQYPLHASYDGNAAKALWNEATKYSINATTIGSGVHTVTLDLVCSNV